MTDTETIVFAGAAVKALGGGKIGGHLVLFSTDADPDLTGEFFTKNTDFDIADGDRSTVLYNHGLNGVIKGRKIGRGTLRTDDVGVWIEAELNLRDEYEQAVYKLAEAGKLGWSSGTASHRVERTPVGKAIRIDSWPLGLDASLTPNPAEPRTRAVPLKSLAMPEAKGQYLGDTSATAAIAAVERLHQSLSYALMRAMNMVAVADEMAAGMEPVVQPTPTERATMAAAAIDEFKDAVSRVMLSLLSDATEVKSILLPLSSFEGRSRGMVADLGEFRRLIGKFDDQRTKAGRVLSDSNRRRIQAVVDAIAPMLADLTALLDTTDPEKARAEADAAKAFAETLRLRAARLIPHPQHTDRS